MTLKINDFITVVKWKPFQDFSYCGDVLQVIAIDAPFLVCKKLSDSTGLLGKVTLDLNQAEIKPLSMEFVNASLEDESWQEEFK